MKTSFTILFKENSFWKACLYSLCVVIKSRPPNGGQYDLSVDRLI